MITKEQLDTANEMIKKINFKGKGYALVASRISAFRAICPRGRINTEILSMENGVVTMKASVFDEDDRELSNGFAQEKEGASYINKTSYIENCETSAIGRALGNLGIGSDENIASAEELANAVLNQGQNPKNQTIQQQEKTDEELDQEMRNSVDPDLVPNPKRSHEERIAKIKAEQERTGITDATLLSFLGVKNWDSLTDAQFVTIISKLKKTKSKS